MKPPPHPPKKNQKNKQIIKFINKNILQTEILKKYIKND